ncbi:cupin domain-containing protein [Ensifer sp. 4252]|uniref:cupin domain-containing protein n=1 Tax=Ensifer sp. 4252 TaxID=3373915 RepID=UPI003D2569D0
MRRLASVLLLTTLIPGPVAASDEPHNAKVTVVFDQVLPNVPGKSMRGVLVEYGPGGHNPSHTHPKSAFIYATVIEGSIKSQINDGPVKVYRTGENWTEVPGDQHRVSANASDSEPAKILAVFVLDTTETEMVLPAE